MFFFAYSINSDLKVQETQEAAAWPAFWENLPVPANVIGHLSFRGLELFSRLKNSETAATGQTAPTDVFRTIYQLRM